MTQIRQRDVRSSVNGLRSVHFGVVEFDRTLDFFVKDWGLTAVASSDGATYLRGIGTAPYVVGLHKAARTEVLRVDLTAPDRAAVDALHARLASRGAAGLVAPAALAEYGGGYGLRVRDTEGRPYLVVAGDERLAPVSSIDLPRKLSHVVLNTRDPASLTEFFEEGLGFRLVDQTRRIHFFNCNSDHHSIALLPSELTTLNHVAFEMDSFDALMRGIGRLRSGGHDIGWGVGRHGPGNNIFVYFVGPEVLPLEYTAEVQQIDDSYRPGTPEDWKPVPGRMDQWGATPPPSQAMKQAEQSVGFAEATL